MTVKELKEILECLIEDGKGHYDVLAGESMSDPIITITDLFEEIFIHSSDEE